MSLTSWESFEKSIDEAVAHRRYLRAANIVKEALYDVGQKRELPQPLIVSADKVAHIQQSRGDFTNAAAIYRLILQAQQKHLSPQHPDIQRTTKQLQQVLGEAGGLSPGTASRNN